MLVTVFRHRVHVIAYALVDDCDAALVTGHRWHMNPEGYILTSVPHPVPQGDWFSDHQLLGRLHSRVPQSLSDAVIWHTVYGWDSTPQPAGPNASDVEEARATIALDVFRNHGDIAGALGILGDPDGDSPNVDCGDDTFAGLLVFGQSGQVARALAVSISVLREANPTRTISRALASRRSPRAMSAEGASGLLT